jgi:hypothetical protein
MDIATVQDIITEGAKEMIWVVYLRATMVSHRNVGRGGAGGVK